MPGGSKHAGTGTRHDPITISDDEAHNRRPRDRPGGRKRKKQKCVVCGDTETRNPSKCSHDPDLCSRCLSQWIEARVPGEIRCPNTGCNIILSHDEVKTHASQAVYEQ
jgi:hypothetical protein